MAKKRDTWDAKTIADFRRAFAELRAQPLWSGYQITAALLNYKSVRGLRWAAGEYHSDGWPGSNRLAAQLREIYEGIFTWIPPHKVSVAPCPSCGALHLVADCHGAPGVPVLLRPGERVTAPAPPKQRKSYYRPCLSWEPHERAAQLRRLLAACDETRA